jgi:hypothetical protein
MCADWENGKTEKSMLRRQKQYSRANRLSIFFAAVAERKGVAGAIREINILACSDVNSFCPLAAPRNGGSS